MRFNDVVAQRKAHLCCQRMHDVLNAFRTLFFHHAAAIADKHCGGVGWLIEQVAQHVAVSGLDLVHEALLKQKLQRAVDGRRLGLRLFLAQQIQQVIGADCPFLQTHQAQHFETLRSQAHAALRAQLFSLR